jgi:adenosylcobyric acid synthase
VTSAADYYARKQELWPAVTESLDTLRAQYDLVIAEGAGSPAEINLRAHDIVNMRVARHANAGTLLVGDIERGGVFASLYGTVALLAPEERALVRAFVINKFRGDASLLAPGIAELEALTGVPTAGVLDWFDDIHVPEEDSLGLAASAGAGGAEAAVLDVVAVRLPHIANFDDFDPLARLPGVRFRYAATEAELGRPDLVILPGSKTTVADLAWMRERGLAGAVVALRRAGTPVLGICGGYQMLGERILDPLGVESDVPDTPGLGLLPVTTTFAAEKTTHEVRGRVSPDAGLLGAAAGEAVTGYEVHMGETRYAGDVARPIHIVSRSGTPVDAPDGASDAAGLTAGTYVHGLLHSRPLRDALLGALAARKGRSLPAHVGERSADAEFDRLADHVAACLDMRLVRQIAGVA